MTPKSSNKPKVVFYKLHPKGCIEFLINNTCINRLL